ncbi:uncharacterized protein [Aegilops tauschii subsp. strangulata]|uniref:uncharacterized protein n=1 Tax=Aegilops tauschii subsp. strangulata TaxID=200361 RepID=UPI003CC8BF25
MDDYLKLHQVPSDDQVKCTTSTFHDYASTWWLHRHSTSFTMTWPTMKKAMRRAFVPSTYTEHLQRQLENTIQGSKSLEEYFKNMKKALRRAGVDDPIWMKFYFMMGLNNDISKTIFLENYKSLDDNCIGALKAEQELKKAKSTRPRAHFTTTTLQDGEHEARTIEMSKPDELQDDASIFGGEIDDVPSSAFIHDESDDVPSLAFIHNESDRVPSSAFIHDESDDVPSSAFIHDESDYVPSSAFIHDDDYEMVEHGIFPSTTATYDNLSDFCHHIESESDFTTSPIYDELPQFPFEESHHHHHHLSDLSDSIICDIECTYLEGVSEPPPHRESEVVDRACEAISISNNLTSTPIVSSHLVLGPIYDDAPILDDSVLPLDKTMATVDYDAPPTWFHHDDDDHKLVLTTSPTPHEWNEKGNIGDGDALVPLAAFLISIACMMLIRLLPCFMLV